MKNRMIMILLTLVLILSGCSSKTSKNVIAEVPEASGICYSTSRDSLFVANDEGSIYEITKKGKKVRKKKIGKYDLEGVACDDENSLLYFAVEVKESILVVDMKSLKVIKEVKIDRAFDGKTVIKKDKEHGIEAITLINGDIYISNQSYKKYPNKDASIVFRVGSLKKKKTKIKEIINHGFVDVAGLSYHNGYLYMVSDKKDLFIKYDLADKKVVKKRKLPKFAQEGITFDGDGYIYFADDEGRVLKYKSKKFL